MNRDEINQLPALTQSSEQAEICPNCEQSWRGSPIPLEHRHFYREGATHYSNLIGIEFPGIYDGIAVWKCPHCGSHFRRFQKL